MNTPWIKVMEEFRGRRLAVHDDLARCGKVDLSAVNVQNALGWLIYHRFVTADHGTLRACDVAEAKRAWQELGPATNAADTLSTAESAPAPQPAARPRVHDHQAKLFAET